MAETKELTLKEIAAHNTKKDLYLIVHDKVYDCTSFVDEHPGGEEVLLDVAGLDGTEAFEDVGHSDEARDILKGMLVGNVKRLPGDPAPKVVPTTGSSSRPSSTGPGFSVGIYAFLLLGVAMAYGSYQYLQAAAAAQRL